MTQSTQHFVLTRFNVRPTSGSETTADDDWLRHRLVLFKSYCLPALERQTEKAFQWLIFCDQASPLWFQDEIRELAANHFDPVWISGAEEIPHEVRNRVSKSACPVITTRLDNDDSVADSFVANIQRNAAVLDEGFINFTYGLQLADGKLYGRLDPSNPFISMVERPPSASSVRTVFVDSHDQLARHGAIVQVKTKALWLQIIHERNIANSAKGIRVGPQAARGFPPSLALRDVRLLTLGAAKLGTTMRMTLRVFSDLRRVRWLWRALIKSR